MSYLRTNRPVRRGRRGALGASVFMAPNVGIASQVANVLPGTTAAGSAAAVALVEDAARAQLALAASTPTGTTADYAPHGPAALTTYEPGDDDQPFYDAEMGLGASQAVWLANRAAFSHAPSAQELREWQLACDIAKRAYDIAAAAAAAARHKTYGSDYLGLTRYWSNSDPAASLNDKIGLAAEKARQAFGFVVTGVAPFKAWQNPSLGTGYVFRKYYNGSGGEGGFDYGYSQYPNGMLLWNTPAPGMVMIRREQNKAGYTLWGDTKALLKDPLLLVKPLVQITAALVEDIVKELVKLGCSIPDQALLTAVASAAAGDPTNTAGKIAAKLCGGGGGGPPPPPGGGGISTGMIIGGAALLAILLLRRS